MFDVWQAVFSALVTALGLFLAYGLVYLFCLPMDRRRPLGSVGQRSESRSVERRRQWVNRVRRAKYSGEEGAECPPSPFPNGWFVIMESRQLKEGDVKFVSALGLNLAVFRGRDSKKAFVTDAYCPHLGADLTVGGDVIGDCVRCPFHHWTFSGKDGRCTEIPYSTKQGKEIPSVADLKTHLTLEQNELIYLWYHSDGEGPTWTPSEIPELSKANGWFYQGRSEIEAACHIQDILENGADLHHLKPVHQSSITIGNDPPRWLRRLSDSLLWLDIGLGWEPGRAEDGRGHAADLTTETSRQLCVLGRRRRGPTSNMSLTQEGPALNRMHNSKGGANGNSVILMYYLPLEPQLQRIGMVMFTQKNVFPPLAKLALLALSIMTERDVPIWNNKKFLRNPVLVKEDAAIKKFRKWYSQFYSTKRDKNKHKEEGL